jgi:asparagine synthase (glutamine-hydrolysing)
MVRQHDEPFSDAANIPLYLLTQDARKDCTVILQGDGGDELFAGYRRYHILEQAIRYKHPIKLMNKIRAVMPRNRFSHRIERFANIFKEKSRGRMFAKYLTIETEEKSPTNVLSKSVKHEISSFSPFARYEEVYERFKHLDGLSQQMLWIDTQIILPDQFLEKVDKSTMASSVEVRVPFLDNDLTSFALGLPGSMKVKGGVKKYILKKALEGVVDDEVLYGPKKGFGVPYQNWIANPLNDFFWDTVKSKYIEELGILDYKYIEHIAKKENGGFIAHGFLLWKIMNLCIWLEEYKIEL